MSSRFRLVCRAVVVACLSAHAVHAAQPSFSLPGLGAVGSNLTTGALSDGTTAIVVWASWSPRCRQIVAEVNTLASRWQGKVTFVTVNFQEDAGDAAKFLDDKLQVPAYLDRDGSFAKAHGVATLPGLIVYRAGKPVYQGRLPADGGDQLLEELRSQPTP